MRKLYSIELDKTEFQVVAAAMKQAVMVLELFKIHMLQTNIDTEKIIEVERLFRTRLENIVLNSD